MGEKRESSRWEGKHYSFFQNTECEYFPCHKGADPARFNCLFCYCPLYMLGPDCGGNFRYTEKGSKDCTGCLFPHQPENYGRITGRYGQIAASMPGGSTVAVLRETKGRIAMMACTERGFDTMGRAAAALSEKLPDTEILQTGRCAHVPGYDKGPGLAELTKKWFGEADALVFFAAAGIAVRCIAPFVRDKFRDPAVLVLDEAGKFVISLLSGHSGGANRLCRVLSEALGAEPVITTATDGRGLFAVDVFAAEHGLTISDREAAKQVSSRILAGETPKIFCDPACAGMAAVPFETKERKEADIILSCRRRPEDREDALYLIPRMAALGIGCRKGSTKEAIFEAAQAILDRSGVFRQALCGIASIDLKQEEPGLLAFARAWELPVTFYSAGELKELPGTFSASEFVQKTTGVDCVCERSAVLMALESACAPGGPGEAAAVTAALLAKKQTLGGVTAALAVMEPIEDDFRIPGDTHSI